jgi:hypothetical protein
MVTTLGFPEAPFLFREGPRELGDVIWQSNLMPLLYVS